MKFRMKMKYVLIFIILWLGISCGAFAQSTEDYEALTSFLPAEKLQNQSTYSELYAQLAFLNRQGYFVGDIGEKDASLFPETDEVEALYPGLPQISVNLIENRELNLIGYNFKIHSDKYSYYRISGSNKVLVIPSREETLKRMNP